MLEFLDNHGMESYIDTIGDGVGRLATQRLVNDLLAVGANAEMAERIVRGIIASVSEAGGAIHWGCVQRRY